MGSPANKGLNQPRERRCLYDGGSLGCMPALDSAPLTSAEEDGRRVILSYDRCRASRAEVGCVC